MSDATSSRAFHVDPDVAIVNGASPDLVGTTGAQHQPAAPLCALPTGSLIASNPPGPRPRHFKVLGNEQFGFLAWPGERLDGVAAECFGLNRTDMR